MEDHPALSYEEHPLLRRPRLIMAWAGWNDAGEAASTAARYLASSLEAKPFARIDPEEFYDFTEARPLARYNDGQREIMWPSTDFYALPTPAAEQDLILGLGIEPNHRWRSYMAAVRALVTTLGAEMVITLGAVVAGVAHTQPIGVRGSANGPTLAKRYSMHPSRYEGPTGIVGVFHDDCRRNQIDGISLWAAVPHYLPGLANPYAARALLERLETICTLPLNYERLKQEETRFTERVEAALLENEELASYVRELEARQGKEPENDSPPPELPSADGLIEDLEDYLRQSRGEES